MTIDHSLRGSVLVVLSIVAMTSGCGSSTELQTAKGEVQWADGNVGDLTNHLVELINTANPSQRSSGVITDNGRFELTTLEDGLVQKGIKPGNYEARIIIVDEGDGQSKKPKLPKRYLDAKTAGWSVQIPASQNIVL
jgi:hypothetical protein